MSGDWKTIYKDEHGPTCACPDCEIDRQEMQLRRPATVSRYNKCEVLINRQPRGDREYRPTPASAQRLERVLDFAGVWEYAAHSFDLAVTSRVREQSEVEVWSWV